MKEYNLKGTDYKIRYNDIDGSKTPILFIPGLGCAGSFDYVEIVTQESLSLHRKITIDLLGTGYSDKPENFNYEVSSHAKYLKEFLEFLNINEIIIFGHSLGGAIAIELCKLYEEKVEALILAESNLDPSQKGSATWKIAHFEEKNIVNEMEKLILRSKEVKNTMWASSIKNCLPKALYELSLSAVKGGSISWRELLYNFKFYKSFIFGEDTLPHKDYNCMIENKINIEIVEKTGHLMTWGNPKGVANTIKKSLDKFYNIK